MNGAENNNGEHWALVTGASSGIGLEYARQLASRRYSLVVVSNEAQRIIEIAEQLRKECGVNVFPLFLDLATDGAAHALHRFCAEKKIGVEVLVNNAGIFFFNDIVRTDAGKIAAMIRLHVETPTLLCRLFGEDMKKRGTGYILNMSSMSAWMPMPGIAVYSSTKAYLRGFSRAFRHEMLAAGIGVTAVCPGGVATGLYRLAPRYQQLGVKLGILMPPSRMVRIALNGMFRKRKQVIPGFINRFFIPLPGLLSDAAVGMIRKKLLKYER